MTTETKRKKLHEFIDAADEQQVVSFYKKIESFIIVNSAVSDSLTKIEKVDLMKQASNDPLFLADMKTIGDDFNVIK